MRRPSDFRNTAGTIDHPCAGSNDHDVAAGPDGSSNGAGPGGGVSAADEHDDRPTEKNPYAPVPSIPASGNIVYDCDKGVPNWAQTTVVGG